LAWAVTVAVPTSHRTAQELPLKSARERMDIISAYRDVGSYRGAAQITGTTPKTVKRVIDRHEAGGGAPGRASRVHNYDGVAELVAARVAKTAGRISAKRLLPAARAAGYEGSPRNFRRLVAAQKQLWRNDNHRGRRPAVWSPGEHLVIDWGVLGGLHVFCAVLAWCRVRFVRFALDERAETTLAMLAECFEALGGVPGVVLADRMGCLKGGVVANRVVPTPQYLRLAAHYGFRPDFCEANDPQSKGIVENLVGYAKRDLIVPQAPFTDLTVANRQAAAWCGGQRGSAQRDLRGAGRATTHRAGVARRVAVAAAQHRAGGDPQGRPAVLRAVRLGPLFGAHPPDRCAGRVAHRRRATAGRGEPHR
jgi:transposase